MECIICFDSINTNINNYIKLECCNQIVHDKCLETWILTNLNKITDISSCFYCKQKNDNIDYIIEIINYSNELESNNTPANVTPANVIPPNVIPSNNIRSNNIRSNNTDSDNILEINNIIRYNNNYNNNHKYTMIIPVTIILLGLVFILIFINL